MGLFYAYTLSLFWSPATSGAAKAHLRVLMAAKSLSFVFAALQLRNGYPPPASYRCVCVLGAGLPCLSAMLLALGHQAALSVLWKWVELSALPLVPSCGHLGDGMG